jgi:hypothetical protein
MPDPAEVITVTLGGLTFRTGRRTAAHIEYTRQRLAKTHPSAQLRIMQGSYNTDVPASAGTHDKDAVIDCELEGVDFLNAQRFLRSHGWAAWWRRPDQGFSNHIHAISLGCPGPLGAFVPRQIDDYWNRRDGLASHAPDLSFFPKDIDSTIFDYPRWLRDQEDKVPYTDWPQADKNALVADVAKKVLGSTFKVNRGTPAERELNVAQALRELIQRT